MRRVNDDPMVQNMEETWLDQALRGDAEGFLHIVDAYQRAVYNLCYRMLGNVEDAEDAAQETFMRAYHNLKKYDRSRSFATWLLSIAAHYCIDQIRKRRMQFVSLDDLPNIQIPDGTPAPESLISKREEQIRVQAILKTLSPLDRAAVVMYYWYDFSYEEIAQSLSLTVSAVKSRLHRARRDMAEEWQHQYPSSGQVERKGYESPVF
ncbi:MAG: RNA polymerase sigma factor [Chloroflexota bacterium]